MQFGVLGPLLVQDANGPVALPSARQRALLAVLLLEGPGAVVDPERLIRELWGKDPPATATKALQVHVSQLRRALGPEQPIVTLPGGYGLRLEPEAIDLHRFDVLLARGRELRAANRLEEARRALREALALWRGPALADVPLLGPSASEPARLNGLWTVAREERIELELACGADAALVPELEALIARDPYREHLHALLMLALYRAGRQATALKAYRRARKVLVDDLGLEPGPELVRLQAAILAQDPALDAGEPVFTRSRGLSAGQSAAPSVPPGEDAGSVAGRPDAAPAGHRAGAAAAIPRAVSSILGREEELRAAWGRPGWLWSWPCGWVPPPGSSSWWRCRSRSASCRRSPPPWGRPRPRPVRSPARLGPAPPFCFWTTSSR